jgi:hypothetical protein
MILWAAVVIGSSIARNAGDTLIRLISKPNLQSFSVTQQRAEFRLDPDIQFDLPYLTYIAECWRARGILSYGSLSGCGGRSIPQYEMAVTVYAAWANMVGQFEDHALPAIKREAIFGELENLAYSISMVHRELQRLGAGLDLMFDRLNTIRQSAFVEGQSANSLKAL